MMRVRLLEKLLGVVLGLSILTACGEAKPPEESAEPALAKELVFYDWADDMPQSVLDAFEAEYGVKVIYPTYETSEEALQNLRAGQAYDLVAVDNQAVPELAAKGLIAEIDHRNVPNLKNISPNFRDLVFDPGNRYSVPYSWGIIGLIVRGDRVPQSVTGWADLWDQRYTGHLLVWDLPRYLMGIALQSLGFSINSENPAELESALHRLLVLRPRARTAGWAPEVSEEALASGEVVLMYGWAGDVMRARARNLDIRYIVPAEGSIQWCDNFVIPAASPHKRTAELFIDFLLRPEIAARIANELYYATPNEAAFPFIKPEILNDPVIFPPIEDIRRAEVIMPLSPVGQALHEQIWQRYRAGRTHAGPSGK